jgi:hypothetical protein
MNYDTTEITTPKLDVEYYGADFPVDVLVKRMEEQDFIIPGFQREYVWKEDEASRFIESLLIGFPVPSLFLVREKKSAKYIVIDGQQRLKALQYFYKGSFPNGKPFKLKGVQTLYNGLTYTNLSLSDQRSLSNAIIHCVIISEDNGSSGTFALFARLNTSGTPLNSQEIRNAIYHGSFSELIQDLSQNETWKTLYDKTDNRSTEQELILRFLALHFNIERYRGDMIDFLNEFMSINQDLLVFSKNEICNVFLGSIQFIHTHIGSKAFYHKKTFNKTLYESLMVITAREEPETIEYQRFKEFYKSLVNDNNFWAFSQHATTSKKNLFSRIKYVNEIYRNTH